MAAQADCIINCVNVLKDFELKTPEDFRLFIIMTKLIEFVIVMKSDSNYLK